MKKLKAICAATLLALSLSIPAFSDTVPGEVHTPGRSAPAPGDVGLPTQETGNSVTSGIASTVGGDSIVSLADIVWAMASIF
jgi:hypothetical protein